MLKHGAPLAVLLLVGIVTAVALWSRQSPATVAAPPETAQARYLDMTVTTSDGREFELPDTTVACDLDFVAPEGEGVYSCPAPHDLSELLNPPQVSSNALARAEVLVEIDAATIFWGLPANSWQIAQIEYGETLNSANVMLGAELTGSETGHIENNVGANYSRGVHATLFYYRAKTNSSGYMGTEWLARGTQ